MTTAASIVCIALCIIVGAVSFLLGYIRGMAFDDGESDERIRRNDDAWKRHLAERDRYWIRSIEEVRMEMSDITQIDRSRRGRG